MRLFLDAHVSGPKIATALREIGHGVRAADEERALDGVDDSELLTLAASENRILITFNVRDFPGIARDWAEAGRQHAGCAIFVGIDHSEYGLIIRRLEEILASRPAPDDWRDYTCFVARGG